MRSSTKKKSVWSISIDMQFTDDQVHRYARQIVLREIGGKGQARLLGARVLCVGAGGLGCPAAIYLAAAGVGTLGVVDDDRVDLSNLQRQILHRTQDVNQLKVDSVRNAVEAINPDVTVVPHAERLASENVERILRDYDVILDCTDNFATRYQIADACYYLKKPLVTGAVFQFEGQVTTILPGAENPCYRCLYPEPPPAGSVPSCAEGGVLGAVVGAVGSLQATEALKILLGIGTVGVGVLLLLNALTGEWQSVSYRQSTTCALCRLPTGYGVKPKDGRAKEGGSK